MDLVCSDMWLKGLKTHFSSLWCLVKRIKSSMYHRKHPHFSPILSSYYCGPLSNRLGGLRRKKIIVMCCLPPAPYLEKGKGLLFCFCYYFLFLIRGAISLLTKKTQLPELKSLLRPINSIPVSPAWLRVDTEVCEKCLKSSFGFIDKMFSMLVCW